MTVRRAGGRTTVGADVVELRFILASDNNGFNVPLTHSTKVVVEGERCSDAEPLHDGKAGAIHKAESLVGVLTEDSPSLCFVCRGDADDRSRGFAQ